MQENSKKDNRRFTQKKKKSKWCFQTSTKFSPTIKSSTIDKQLMQYIATFFVKSKIPNMQNKEQQNTELQE